MVGLKNTYIVLLGARTLHIKRPLEISSAIAASNQLMLFGILTLEFYLLTREKNREIWVSTDYIELYSPLQVHIRVQSSGAIFKLFELVFCFYLLLWDFSAEPEDGCLGLFMPFSFLRNQFRERTKLVLKWPFGFLRPLVYLFVTSVVTSVGSAH